MNPAKKILLIDDDRMMAEMIGMLVSSFRRGSFTLEHAGDYANGLRELVSGAYDLCLLDYHLDTGTGLDLLREAAAARCATPVIMLTGSSHEGTDLAAMDGGAVDFLDKGELTLRGLERAVYYALESAGALAEMRKLAAHDELTGAANRREFDRRLQYEWDRSVRHQRPLALVMLDVDRFKAMNDTHGHPVGDAVLRHFAQQLAQQIRSTDCLARFGGDEFALILVETDHAAALATAVRLHQTLGAAPCRVPAKDLILEMAASVGVAAWPQDADSLPGLIAAADAALYAAKRHGRNRVVAAGAEQSGEATRTPTPEAPAP